MVRKSPRLNFNMRLCSLLVLLIIGVVGAARAEDRCDDVNDLRISEYGYASVIIWIDYETHHLLSCLVPGTRLSTDGKSSDLILAAPLYEIFFSGRDIALRAHLDDLYKEFRGLLGKKRPLALHVVSSKIDEVSKLYKIFSNHMLQYGKNFTVETGDRPRSLIIPVVLTHWQYKPKGRELTVLGLENSNETLERGWEARTMQMANVISKALDDRISQKAMQAIAWWSIPRLNFRDLLSIKIVYGSHVASAVGAPSYITDRDLFAASDFSKRHGFVVPHTIARGLAKWQEKP